MARNPPTAQAVAQAFGTSHLLPARSAGWSALLARRSSPVPFRSCGKLQLISASAVDAAPAGAAPPPPPLSEYARHKWSWEGKTINYVSAGCGKPVLLVHGFGANLGHWRKNVPALVEAGYKVYAIDLLGFGDSDKPLIDYSMELWEQQLKAFISEFMGGQQVVVMGNSVGSLACLMVSASLPDQVAGTVLFNCAGGMNNKAIVGACMHVYVSWHTRGSVG
jgi:pimeloyl-ACP methyl ester carboxylesterase